MNKKGFLNRILSNDIVLMVLSLILAFGIWFFINANSQTESNVTISNIPISIELPKESVEDGLEVLASSESTASVEVSGNRIIVGSLSASDIQVVALQSNAIIAPGEYTLDLTAKKVGVKTNYNLAPNVTPSSVTIYVDKYKEKTFNITDDIVYKVQEGYYANSSLSETSVTVKGPETTVMAIEEVVVQGTLDGTDGNKKQGTFELVCLDKDKNLVDVSMLELSVDFVDATLTPLPIREVSLDVELVNAPKNYPTISIYPRKIKIAGEKSVLDNINDNKVIIGKLDFSQLSNKSHKKIYDIVLPVGCKNLSDSTSTDVQIDLSGYKSKKLTVNNFSGVNIDLTKHNVVFNSSGIEIEVCGPSELVKGINSGDVIPMIDFTSKLDDIDKDSVSLELPVTFKFTKDYLNCWVYGSYTVNVNVTKK